MAITGFERNFGFGFMRLPEIEKGVYDIEETKKMVDTFMQAGFTYFDTAHGYCESKSELVLRETLVERYPRESYTITDKLSGWHFKTEAEILPLFESQLEAVGVDYFDYYLMHAQDKKNFEHYKQCNAYETAFELKKQGRVKHVGISFHDSAEFLDEILTAYPQIEVVQIQFNYLDYDSPSTQSKACYDVCRKHNKPMIIMEPVKGGSLVNLPPKAQEIFDNLKGGSNASYAIRFAAGFEGVAMVISGMSNNQMVVDNVGYMQDYKPLTGVEKEAIGQVVNVLKGLDNIPCTACSYCTEKCPSNIPIPRIFEIMNKSQDFDFDQGKNYNAVTEKMGKASGCIECGACEKVCPQHIEIRPLLKKAKELFEQN